ncbi:MAG TPA: nuclear transport factor 2 family protein [Actinomycetota bacterium]
MGQAGSSSPGERFVRAVAAKDLDELKQVLDPAIDFRGLTPSRAWEAGSPDEVAEIVFGSWFEPQDHVLETLAAEDDGVGDRHRLRYRFRVESDGDPYLVEQQGYYDTDGERITRMSIVCSGYRDWPA